jgi:hypothetical protein
VRLDDTGVQISTNVRFANTALSVFSQQWTWRRATIGCANTSAARKEMMACHPKSLFQRCRTDLPQNMPWALVDANARVPRNVL